jgi:hypothetical protein
MHICRTPKDSHLDTILYEIRMLKFCFKRLKEREFSDEGDGYPTGRGTYTKTGGQTVNPLTGQTVAPSNPWWHIPGGK